MLTEIGPVETQAPRDTDASFDPQIVKKRQRRLTGVDEIVLSPLGEGPDHRGNRGALRRRLRSIGLEGDDQQDHRQSDRGDDRLVRATSRPGVSGSVQLESHPDDSVLERNLRDDETTIWAVAT